MLIIPTLSNLRQDGDCEVEASLGSIVNVRPAEDMARLSQKATEV